MAAEAQLSIYPLKNTKRGIRVTPKKEVPIRKEINWNLINQTKAKNNPISSARENM
jgi:hypothetical protein